jgi:hypothetical protein
LGRVLSSARIFMSRDRADIWLQDIGGDMAQVRREVKMVKRVVKLL